MVYSLRASFFCLAFALLCEIVLPVWLNHVKIIFVAAPLVMIMYNATLAQTIWTACIIGLIQDTVYLSPRLGFMALSFVITCRILYPLRLYFFKDSIITLPLMTYLFSSIHTLIGGFVALFFAAKSPLVDLRSVISDLFVMPFYDVIFAVVVFMLFPFFYSSYCKAKRQQER